MEQLNADRLFTDLDAVAADMEELIEATSGGAGEASPRDRIEHSLRRMRRNLAGTRACAVEEAKNVAQSADAYLRENIWKAIGVASGVGLLFGAIVGLTSRSSRRPPD